MIVRVTTKLPLEARQCLLHQPATLLPAAPPPVPPPEAAGARPMRPALRGREAERIDRRVDRRREAVERAPATVDRMGVVQPQPRPRPEPEQPPAPAAQEEPVAVHTARRLATVVAVCAGLRRGDGPDAVAVRSNGRPSDIADGRSPSPPLLHSPGVAPQHAAVAHQQRPPLPARLARPLPRPRLRLAIRPRLFRALAHRRRCTRLRPQRHLVGSFGRGCSRGDKRQALPQGRAATPQLRARTVSGRAP